MNIAELNAEMGRNNMSIPKLALELGLSKKTLYSRFKGETTFKQEEIAVISKVLNLSRERIYEIFFAKMVS